MTTITLAEEIACDLSQLHDCMDSTTDQSGESRETCHGADSLAINFRILIWLRGIEGVRVPCDEDHPILAGVLCGLIVCDILLPWV